eukprot:gb/GEZN01024035.1/.p1 GENE.gb/GEZN01024035.1/~~gb/GEZN01024035.1/.p1  ORF type:complete len:130 (-),score=11.55 gb/GEZN01024035.1/:48-437(-)
MSGTSTLPLDLFDQVVESCVVGARKPDPAIFQLLSKKLQLPPDKCVFLDDIGYNCKAARKLGFYTIKVSGNGLSALVELGNLLQLGDLTRTSPPDTGSVESLTIAESRTAGACASSGGSRAIASLISRL